MNENNDTCQICNSNKIKTVSIGGVSLINCSDCGVFYNAEISTAEELEKYYEEEYVISANAAINAERRRFFRIPEQIQLVAMLKEYVKPPASILDIGCDRGYFLDEARKYGYTVTGVELSNSAREYCRITSIDTFKTIDEIQDKFDIITMWHSLEHFPEPYAALNQIKTKMNPNAYLFVRVPAFDTVWRKLFGRRWIWFQPQNHYFHYSAASLSKLLNNSGFEVLSISHRKPNDRFTKRAFRLANAVFRRSYQMKITFKERIARAYEDLVGVELFAVCKINR